MKRNTDSTLQFFDLPWNDILIKKIMVYVLPHDWLNLRIVSKRAYHLVSDYLSRIRYLDLSTCNRFPKALWKEITNNCKFIKVLKLPNSPWFDDESVKEIFQNNPNLGHLDLTDCSHLKNGSLQPLVINCKKLENLVLKNCVWVTNGAMEVLAFHSYMKIKYVDFTGCCGISEASIILFIARQPKLLSISLADLTNVTDRAMECLAQNCPMLQHLDISRCSRVTDTGVMLIGKYCPRLESLKVNGCRDISERSLSKLRTRIKIDKKQIPQYLLHRQIQMNSVLHF